MNIKYAIIVFLSLTFIGFWSVTTKLSLSKEKVEVISEYHVSEILDKSFYEEASKYAPDFSSKKKASVLILPHHLVAKPLILGALQMQSDLQDPKYIVLIAPDHMSAGASQITTTDLPWKTPTGFMYSEVDVVNKLINSTDVSLDREVFDKEFSTAALIPFIHSQFPKAKIVPIIVKEGVSESVIQDISKTIKDDDVLYIVSIDFSHYMPENVAYFHDTKSISAMERLAYNEIEDLDIDSTTAMRFAFNLAENLNSLYFDMYINENSDSFFGYPVEETTSYVIGGYVRDKVDEYDTPITILNMGDLMFDRGVREKINKFGYEYPFEKIAGLEGRFFRGVDLIVGNLEGPITTASKYNLTYSFSFDPKIVEILKKHNFSAVSLANNHSLNAGNIGHKDTIKYLSRQNIGAFGNPNEHGYWTTTIKGKDIAFLGINLVGISNPDFNSIKETMDVLDKGNDILVVHIHWGDEYFVEPNKRQVKFGRSLVDWGADLVIGHHPHVMQGMETYKGVPILWSLGNFIFDQYGDFEMTHGLAAGVTFRNSSTEVTLFPVEIDQYRPSLIKSPEKEDVYKIITDRSVDTIISNGGRILIQK